MKRLKMTATKEVSMVKKGANKRKFLVFKSAEGSKMTQEEILKSIGETDPAILERVEQVLKNFPPAANPAQPVAGDPAQAVQPVLSQGAQTALRAFARILAPFKNEISLQMLEQVAGGVGLPGAQAPKQPIPGMEAGVETAEPDEEGALLEDDEMDAEDSEDGLEDDADEEIEEGDEEKVVAPAKKPATISKEQEENKVLDPTPEGEQETQEGDKVSKTAILKADGSLDLAAIPEEIRPVIEVIQKSQQDALAENKSLKEQIAKQSEEIKKDRDERRLTEFVAKAESFKHFKGDKKALAKDLMALSDSSPELYKSTISTLESVEVEKAAIAKSGLFNELGTSLPGETGSEGEFEQKMDVLAKSLVAKSSGLTYEKAYEQALSSVEGTALYEQFRSARKDGV